MKFRHLKTSFVQKFATTAVYGVLESCLFALVCIQIELQRNFKLYCLYFFFRNLSFQIGGAAYLRVRLIHGTLRYFLEIKLDLSAFKN